MPQETRYSTRFSSPETIQREEDQTIELPLYYAGALVAPSSGTVSVLRPDGTALVDGQAVTVTANIATYAITAATVPSTETLGDRWQVRWSLTVGGKDYLFQREAALVRRRLYPVVADLDMTRLHTELREWLADDQSSLQGFIDAAWDDLHARLREDGRWPHLILSPSSLRTAHLYCALSMAFRDYASSAGGTDGKYDKLAEFYMGKWEEAWGRIRLTYDFSDDGLIAEDDQGVSGPSVLFLNKPSDCWYRWP